MKFSEIAQVFKEKYLMEYTPQEIEEMHDSAILKIKELFAYGGIDTAGLTDKEICQLYKIYMEIVYDQILSDASQS